MSPWAPSLAMAGFAQKLPHFSGGRVSTHDQAAARLGWPVGTVKGRLSRARDLLRTRLSRRGVAVSSTALAAHLAGAELKASVPASLTHLTLNAALAVVIQGGVAITARS